MAQLAQKTNSPVSSIEGMCIWGNHSATQYPDLHRVTVSVNDAMDLVDMSWYVDEFIPTVQQRGAAIIEARGASSAASAANAAIDHMRDWAHGNSATLSMGVYSNGSYGIEEGLIYSFPVNCSGGDWSIQQGIDLNDFSVEERPFLRDPLARASATAPPPPGPRSPATAPTGRRAQPCAAAPALAPLAPAPNAGAAIRGRLARSREVREASDLRLAVRRAAVVLRLELRVLVKRRAEEGGELLERPKVRLLGGAVRLRGRRYNGGPQQGAVAAGPFRDAAQPRWIDERLC